MKKLFTGCYYFIYFIKSTIRCIKSDTVILVKPIIHNSPLFPKHNLFFQKDWVRNAIAPGILFSASVATWGQKNKSGKTETGIFQTLRHIMMIIFSMLRLQPYTD